MESKSRILMVLDEPFPPDVRVENEVRSLISAGFAVSLLSLAPYPSGTPARIHTPEGLEIVRVRIPRQLRNKMRGLAASVPVLSLFVSHQIQLACKKRRIDAIHMHDLWLFGGGLRAGRILGIPVVGDLHENFAHALTHYSWSTRIPGRWLVNLKRWHILEGEWTRAVDRLICVVEEQRDRIEALGVATSRCVLVPNTISTPTFDGFEVNHKLVDALRSPFTIVYTGSINMHRGLDTLLHALHLLRQHCDARLVIVGEGRIRPELELLAQSFGQADHVDFVGWQDQSLVKSYILGGDVGVAPHVKGVQNDAGIPHKLFHYMYLKRPAVVTDCIPMQRIVEAHDCGLVCRSGDPASLSEVLLRLYRDPDLRMRQGENGHRAVVDRYNWDVTAQAMIKMYRDLLA